METNHSFSVVIMAGGRGERFWPRSRRARPKQFASVLSEKTMLQETADRFPSEKKAGRLFVSTGKDYIPLVKESLPQIDDRHILVEPMARDTAAAVCLATLDAPVGDDDLLFFVPADHHIGNVEAYHRDIQLAAQTVKTEQAIVLLGIPPTEPSENFGYIHVAPLKHGIHSVAGFREKPNRETAETYLSEGSYLWNAGMFVFTRRILVNEFKRHASEILIKVQDYLDRRSGDHESAQAVFSSIPKISFDFAVIEKTEKLFCVPASFSWDDVGSWNAVSRLNPRDAHDNCLSGSAFIHECREVTIQSNRQDLQIVASHVEGLHIIVDGGVIYVTKRDKENEVKAVLKRLGDSHPTLL